MCYWYNVSNMSKEQTGELKSRPSLYLSELILHINAMKPSINGVSVHMRRK